MAQDYAKTLNLPKTDFPMRANLPQKEPEILAKWNADNLYGKMMEKNTKNPSFVLHDGPPYANGDIHTGHALNKIIKDIIFKHKNMSGRFTPYIHGWDTHGLPIERQMIKKHKIDRDQISDVQFRKLCEQFARDAAAAQREQIKRLGCFGDYENSYLTLTPDFEAHQIEIFGKMAEKGYIYKGMKPVYWCAHDETALAEAEIEYEDDPCDSVYVRFRVLDDKGLFSRYVKDLSRVYFVIWTTTAWTLPGNMAICLGADFEYAMIQYGGDYYIIAKRLKEAFEKSAGLAEGNIIAQFSGSDLEYSRARHPFFDRESLVVVGDHVGLDAGTGCVHTAPGHGLDDFLVCKKYQVDVIVPVDGKGYMNEQAGKYQGLSTSDASKAILADLAKSGALVATEHIIHQYPHCWRCKTPIVYRATEQWFCSVDGFKDIALSQIKKVKWIPGWGEQRIENMVRDRNDWCISRQRLWGVPIPIFYCESCEKPLLNRDTIAAVSALFKREGSNAWFQYAAKEILPAGTVCECGARAFFKETDIMDVWFDSGSSYATVLTGQKGFEFPADLYLEGNDQYRGWFQSSLLTSCATRGIAPYKSVLTHGMVVDGEGKKMSKSLGNGIDPLDVIKEYGADVLRLWVSSVDFTSDVRISPDILKQLSEIYRKIRNTIRIMLANLGNPGDDFDPNRDMVRFSDLHNIDKWILSQYNNLAARVGKAYENYEFHLIYHDIHNFCAIELSKLYIDITKDRVYVEKASSPARRSAQTAMYLILNGLVRMLAPILSYTAEETWRFMACDGACNKESVFLNSLPEYNGEFQGGKLAEDYNRLFAVRDDVMKALELARAQKLIGKSLDAAVTIFGDGDREAMKLFYEFEAELATIFIVSKVTLRTGKSSDGGCDFDENGICVFVEQADGEKCARCWSYSDHTENDERGQPLCARCAAIVNSM